MKLIDLGKKLAAIGLPLLGGAVGGPGGAIIGKGIAAALGLGDDATPEQTATALGNMTGEQLVALRALELDLAKEQLKAESERDKGQVELLKIDGEKGGFFQRGGDLEQAGSASSAWDTPSSCDPSCRGRYRSAASKAFHCSRRLTRWSLWCCWAGCSGLAG